MIITHAQDFFEETVVGGVRIMMMHLLADSRHSSG